MTTTVAKYFNLMSVISVTNICNTDIQVSILAMCSQLCTKTLVSQLD